MGSGSSKSLKEQQRPGLAATDSKGSQAFSPADNKLDVNSQSKQYNCFEEKGKEEEISSHKLEGWENKSFSEQPAEDEAPTVDNASTWDIMTKLYSSSQNENFESISQSIASESWNILKGKNEWMDMSVAFGKSIVKLTQGAPFVGPAMTAVAMFIDSYEQLIENKEIFVELKKVVEYSDTWKKEIAELKVKITGTIAEESQKEFVSSLTNALVWMKHVDKRLNSKRNETKGIREKIGSAASGIILSGADKATMNEHMTKLKQALDNLKSDVNFRIGVENRHMLELATLRTSFGSDVAEYNNFVQSRIDELESKFLRGSREWMFARVSSWMRDRLSATAKDNEESAKIFWIRSDAGMGKSCVAARCCLLFEEDLVGKVFFSYTEDKRSKAEIIVKSLAVQIAEKYPEVIPDMLRVKTTKIDEMFEKLVINPLKQLSGKCASETKSGSLLLIIDALDECKHGKERKDLLRFLGNSFLAKLPSFVKVLITSRPEPDILAELESFHPDEISEDDPRHQADLRCFIESVLREFNRMIPRKMSEERISTLTEQFFTSSRGSFLYVALMEEILKKLKKVPDEERIIEKFNKLPRALGIDAVFHNLMAEENIFELNKNFLHVMTASKELLSVNQLYEILEEEEVNRAYADDTIRLLFPHKEIGSDEYFVPFHKSVLDILKDRERAKEYWVNPKEAHNFMVEKLLNIIGRPWRSSPLTVEDISKDPKFSFPYKETKEALSKSPLAVYVLQYLDDHLDDMEEVMATFLVLTDFTWIELRRSYGKNGFAAASCPNLTAVREDLMKRIRSESWMKGSKEVDYIQELKYLNEFLAVAESGKMAEEMTGMFQKLILTDQLPLREHSRIRYLMVNAIAFLEEDERTGSVRFNSGGSPQIGDGLVGRYPNDQSENKCTMTIAVMLEKEGIFIYSHGRNVALIDIVSCCEIEGGTLRADDYILKAFYSKGFVVLGFSHKIEMWWLEMKTQRWSFKKRMEGVSVITMYKISNEEMCIWTKERGGFILSMSTLAERAVDFPINDLVQTISFPVCSNDDCILTPAELDLLQSCKSRYWQNSDRESVYKSAESYNRGDCEYSSLPQDARGHQTTSITCCKIDCLKAIFIAESGSYLRVGVEWERSSSVHSISYTTYYMSVNGTEAKEMQTEKNVLKQTDMHTLTAGQNLQKMVFGLEIGETKLVKDEVGFVWYNFCPAESISIVSIPNQLMLYDYNKISTQSKDNSFECKTMWIESANSSHRRLITFIWNNQRETIVQQHSSLQDLYECRKPLTLSTINELVQFVEKGSLSLLGNEGHWLFGQLRDYVLLINLKDNSYFYQELRVKAILQPDRCCCLRNNSLLIFFLNTNQRHSFLENHSQRFGYVRYFILFLDQSRSIFMACGPCYEICFLGENDQVQASKMTLFPNGCYFSGAYHDPAMLNRIYVRLNTNRGSNDFKYVAIDYQLISNSVEITLRWISAENENATTDNIEVARVQSFPYEFLAK